MLQFYFVKIPEENDTTISIIFCCLEHRRSGLGKNSLGITYSDSVSISEPKGSNSANETVYHPNELHILSILDW